MRRSTYIKLATNILVHSKIRSWLTIIGIVIGVGSVVTIMALSDSMAADMEEQFADMDLTLIQVTPGYSHASAGGPGGGPPGSGGSTSSSSSSDDDDPELTKKDIQALKAVSNIDYIYGEISGSDLEVYFMGETADLSVTGVDSQVWQYTVTYDLESGRLLDASDANVVVIGYGIAHDMFDDEVGLNRVLTIEGKSYRVVGILAEDEDDNSIFMPIDAAVEIVEDAEDDVYDTIVVKASDVDYVETVVDDIEERLMLSRGIMDEDDRDFSVSDSLSRAESASEMMESMTIFLGAIAGVSLLVGSVGIANTMFTSVMEKTKEIGTMKAIGAKNRDILMIFLFNSALVGFVGGVLGILLSLVLTMLMPYLGISMMRSSMGMTVAPYLMVLGVSIAIFIGVLSGIIPAYNASKMKPVDALRYE
ncbi:ABC-type antimicrobial peptide transport system, permease component [Methanolobus tindarius DSM 2278]|uniref:ABC-type antimicrobial peptide transport system, permease component n=1 Tax=Methanolobus tindarius DSM 2278 TaxID=1090322 RepID=W9DXJ8_METTI|nr:ABC transporter permease [Methanolobus tindarius]ETA68432.1 ABC-type antimicrobial peptide transport system, permease component [Methanolobus tindarius DSM 2278]